MAYAIFVLYALFIIDLVAQLVEHVPFKDGVLGSSPSQVTYKNLIHLFINKKQVDFFIHFFVSCSILSSSIASPMA